MKISLDFKELATVMAYPNIILSDKSVDDKMKNVIFIVREGEVNVVGYNALSFSKTALQNVTVEDIPNEGWDFQVKASELNKIISSFSNMYKTRVNTIDFESNGVKIGVVLHEEPIDEKDTMLAQKSEFLLENAPILSNIKAEIMKEFPDDGFVGPSGELMVYLDSLFPLLDSTSINSTAGKINFAPDYVFVVSKYASAFFVNKLPDAFKGISLGYSSVNFLRKMCDSNEDIIVSKIDKYLCIMSGCTQVFMRYQGVKFKYEIYLQRFKKEKGILLDRLYLKDVLKRVGNVSQEGILTVTEDGVLDVSTNNFNQIIPLTTVKEGTQGVSFKVSISSLMSCIVGSDAMFSDELFMYFNEQGRGYSLFLSDKTGAWCSNIQVSRV